MIIVFYTAKKQMLTRWNQEQQEGKQQLIMCVVILQNQITFYSHRPLKEDGKAGMLLRMAIMDFCAGLMMRGRKIQCATRVMVHGLRVIVILFIRVAIVVFASKNYGKGLL